MLDGSTPLAERARTIFTDLGYEVSDGGREFFATREWKRVHVTTLSGAREDVGDAALRCFVTWEEGVTDLLDAVRRTDPTYDWALIGVGTDGGYEVARAP